MYFDEDAPLRPQNPLVFNDYQDIGLVCYTNCAKKSRYNERKLYLSDINSKIELNENDIINEILSEDDVREALEIFVNNHCCYSKNPLKKLKLNNIESTNCFRYVLQTFTETRTTSYAYEPYNPYMANEFKSYNPEDPWSVNIYPKELFTNEVVRSEIPNTTHIEDCNGCSGMGSKTCDVCEGNSKKLCWICDGSGYSNFGISDTRENFKDSHHYENNNFGYGNRKNQYQLQNLRNQYYNHRNFQNSNSFTHTMDHIYCLNCNGKGSIKCNHCNDGEINCRVCNATGRLRWFIQLEASFAVFEDDYVDREKTNLSEDIIRGCLAKEIYAETSKRIKPIKNNFYFKFNQKSKYLIDFHLSKYSHTRILAQRQQVYLIPVTCGSFTENVNDFYIYGMDHQVLYPNYPGKFKCTIL